MKRIVNNKEVVFITLACPYFNDPRVTQEVQTLIKNNFFPYILSWDRDRKFSDLYTSNIVVEHVRLLYASSFSKFAFLFSALLFQIIILLTGIKLIKQYESYILHVNDFNTLFGAFLLKIIFKDRIRLVYDSHELTPEIYKEFYGEVVGSIVGLIEKSLLKKADRIIAATYPTCNYLKKETKKDITTIANYPSKILIPKLSKTELRKELGLSVSSFIVVFVGSLRFDVAIQELIEAAKEYKNDSRHIEILIIGDGPLENELLNHISQNNVSNIITYMGRIERLKAIKYLKAADVSYAVYKANGGNSKIGLSWKLFESVACETPPIVLGGTVAAKFVKTKNIGYILNEIDPKKIAELLKRIMTNGQAMNFGKNQYLWENQEELFIRNYQ